MSKSPRLIAALFFTLFATAPVTSQEPAKANKSSSAKKESVADLAKKLRGLKHGLEMARLKLELAQLDERVKVMGAESSQAKAERELQQAKKKLAHFDGAVAPARLTDAKISLDSVGNRAQQAQDEYNELVAMYKQEEFAEMTKELVLKRGRHTLDIARRRLELQTKKYTDLEKAVLPRERAELVGKVEDATVAAKKSRLTLEKTKLEVRISLAEAKFKIDSTQQDLDEVRNKLGRTVEK